MKILFMAIVLAVSVAQGQTTVPTGRAITQSPASKPAVENAQKAFERQRAYLTRRLEDARAALSTTTRVLANANGAAQQLPDIDRRIADNAKEGQGAEAELCDLLRKYNLESLAASFAGQTYFSGTVIGPRIGEITTFDGTVDDFGKRLAAIAAVESKYGTDLAKSRTHLLDLYTTYCELGRQRYELSRNQARARDGVAIAEERVRKAADSLRSLRGPLSIGPATTGVANVDDLRLGPAPENHSSGRKTAGPIEQLATCIARGLSADAAAGETHLVGNGIIESKEEYHIPLRIDVVAKIDRPDFRLYYGHGSVILSWANQPDQLRLTDPLTGGVLTVGDGHLSLGRWAHITWIITADETTLQVDGQQRGKTRGPGEGFAARAALGPFSGAEMSVKSFSITPLADQKP